MFNVQDWLKNKSAPQGSPDFALPVAATHLSAGVPAQAETGPPSQPQQQSDQQNDFGSPSSGQPQAQPQTPAAAIQPQKPFMAEAVDSYGNPFYGGGFKGWARGTFARIFDPQNFTSNIKDQNFLDQAKQQAADYSTNIERLTRWDEWGQNIFGISSQDLGTSLSAMQAEKHYGQATGQELGTGVSAITGLEARGLKEAGMTALGAFGLFDYLHRKSIMTRQANYTLAQQTDLYQAAKDAGVGQWLLGRGPEWKVGPLSGGVLAETPLQNVIDPLRMFRDSFDTLAILTDKDTRKKWVETVLEYQRGSGMAYTMVSDAAKRQTFIDRINQGDNPALVAAEEGKIWTEVGGSIFGDPTTYMGLTLYGKGSTILKIPFTGKPLTIAGKVLKVPWQKVFTTPTFGELVGFGLKAERTRAALQVASAIPEAASEVSRMERVAQEAGGWSRIADDSEAFGQIKKMGESMLETVNQWTHNLEEGKLPNARTLSTSAAKANQMYRNTHDALALVLSGGGTIDDRLESLNTLRNMHVGNDAARSEAIALAIKEHGQLAMSDGYLQLGKFLSSFTEDEDIAKLVSKAGEGADPAKMMKILAPKLTDFANQFYPSMDEMATAAEKFASKGEEIKAATKTIEDLRATVDQMSVEFTAAGPGAKKSKDLVQTEKALAQAQKSFVAAYGKDAELARAYEQINPLVRKGRQMLKTYEKTFYRPVKAYMDTIFLALRPAQYAKQVQSQTALIAMDLGIMDSLEILGRTAITSFSDKWTAQMIEKNSAEIEKVLGIIPEAMTRGVTAAGEAKGKGFLRVSGNLDTLMSGEIMLRTARREMEKVMSNSRGILDVKRLEGIFNNDELGIFQRLLSETHNESQAVREFQTLAKKGTAEAWRYLPMSPTMKDFTQQSGLYEEFQNVQKTARTREEFTRRVDDLVSRMTQQATRVAAADPPVVDEATHQVIRDAFLEAQDLASQGKIPEAEAKIFDNSVNAFEYMRRNLEDGAKAFRNATDVFAAQAGIIGGGEYQSAIRTLDEATGAIHEIYPQYDETARLVRSVLRENKNLPSSERALLLDNARFDLQKYTGLAVDELGNLDPKDFEKAVWSGYFSWGREYWRDGNTEILARTVDSLDALAQTVGMKAEDVIQQSSTIQEYLYNARRYQQQGSIWENQMKYVSDNLAQIANAYGIPTASAKGQPISRNLVKILNDNLPEGVQPFTDLKDAQTRIDEARIALAQWSSKTKPQKSTEALAKVNEFLGTVPAQQVPGAAETAVATATPPVGPAELQKIPPVVHPGTATGAQAMHENLISSGFMADLQAWTDSVNQKWGSLQELNQIDAGKHLALADWEKEAIKRMNVVRAKINKVATMQRDDILLSYDKTYGDLALAYMKPYHYWQTRQYVKSFARFVDHPSWANGYMQYKNAMAKENADLPEWWRYNLAIQDLPGIHLQHPFYVNIESAINPIYDLTGTDFNDPYKRVDWLSRTVDDLSKTGGTFMPPIQWAVALNLYRKGETDAANRWMGRVLGQTGQAIKAGLTATGSDINLGNFIQHNEVDPFVNFLMGGLDPQERKRLGRQLAGMVQDGNVDPAQALDAIYQQSGPLYDEALRQSVLARSPSELKSFFLGVNWKPRTEEDAQIDTFYQEYYQLRAQSQMMPPDDYRRAWDNMREKYKFMDTVLLSGKNTPDREQAYTYNVFSRVPPGQAFDLYKAAGVDPKLAQLFFDSKGDMPGISKPDHDTFMAGVANLGAMLAIPDYTTKQDWNTARDGYKQIQEQMKLWYGPDINDKIDFYQSLDDKEKQMFVDTNPNIKAALDWKNQQVISNPQIYQYYGGISSLERFFKGKVYAQMDQEFGPDIQAKWNQYYEMQMYDPSGARKFYKANFVLKAYSARKAELMDAALRNIVIFASKLPEADVAPVLRETRPASVGQQNIAAYANQPPQPTLQDYAAQLPTETRIIAEYWNGNIKRLPSAVTNSLDYKARDLGFANGDDLLQAILISMQQGQQNPLALQQ